jgi:SAM-dependent methyltransferase
MSLIYRVMYRIGFTPWDNGEVPAELSAIVEGSGAVRPGRALDIGCGTGTQAMYLARNGWRVTAIDAIERALARARARAQGAGVTTVDWIRADVTALGRLGLEPGFTLVFDRGCFHGLGDDQRAEYAAGATALAAPGATLLMMAFAPSRMLGAPAGVDEAEIVARFAGWELADTQPDTDAPPPGPMKNVPRHWYRLVRR